MHAVMKSPAIAPHVAREDGLPHGGPEPSRRQRAAQDVVEGEVKRAADLEEQAEEPGGVRARQRAERGEPEVAVDFLGERRVPAEPRDRVLRCADQAGQLVEVPVVEEVERQVLVEPELALPGPRAPGQALAQRVDEHPDLLAEPGDVGVAVPRRDGRVPHGARRDELGPQGRALGLDALGQAGVPVDQLRDRLDEPTLALGHERHCVLPERPSRDGQLTYEP
jgi:hypothetical protein